MAEASGPAEAAAPATAGGIARAVREGERSAAAIMDATLARIRERDPGLRAFTEIYEAEALEGAARIDAALADGAPMPPLAGVPVAVKDLTPLAGKRTTLGSLVHRDEVGAFDPVYVRRLRAAGAIVIGKTNTPEFAHAGFCSNRVFGTTRNPRDPQRTPGGSSGGAGAAVGAGMVPIAEGTDMGGSVRIPAAYCGVVGLKPALGRIPMDILPSAFDTISHFGPLAATVEDAWRFLAATQGPDESDPLSLPAQDIPFDRSGAVAGLRIALSPDLGFFAVEDEVAENLARTAERLRGLGACVETVPLAWDHEVFRATQDNWAVFIDAFHGHLLEDRRDELDPENVAMMEHARRIGATAYKRIELVRTRLWRDLSRLLCDHDLLLCPTVPCTAPAVTGSDRDYGHRDARGRTVAAEMTAPFNFVPHCPALTVPSGTASDGLPTAVQIVGRRFDEATVLRAGRAIERAGPSATQT